MTTITPFNLGEYIKSALENNQTLKSEITKISPIVTSENTKFPFIVYKLGNCMGVYTKDRLVGYNIETMIEIQTDVYNNLADISNEIQKTMNSIDFGTSYFKLDGCTDGFSNDVYFMTFSYSFFLKA